jgi:hypothetical protein
MRSSLLCLLLIAAPAAAQNVYEAQTLLQDGDAVAGVGSVTAIENLAVNALGQWVVELDTDNIDTNIDGALVRDGVLLLQEGQALAAPAGASIDSFDAVNLNAAGNSGWNFFLDGTTGSGDDSGIYFGSSLVLQEGTVSTAAGFSAGTPYVGFFETKIDDADRILAMASVDDPAITSTVDRALVLLTLDGLGGLAGESVLWKEGDVLPGQVAPVTDWDTGPHGFAMNNAGQVLHNADLAGDTAFNQAIYLDSTVVAQKGTASPVAGRNWSSLSGSRLELNDAGSWVASGSFDGDAATNSVLVRDGALFMQEGGAPSDAGGFLLTGFGTGPVEVGNNGNVLWFGDWNDPDTTRDTGLFLNGKLIVQEGVTTIGGVSVLSLVGVQDGYALSADGRYVLLEARLAGSIDGAFLIDTGPWENLGHALAGTDGTPWLLGTGTLEAGTDVAFHLTEARPSANTTLVIGATALLAPFKGGTLVPFPSLLIPMVTDASGSASIGGTWPAGVPTGTELYAQHWLSDPAGPEGFAASNAVKGLTP